VESEQEIAAQAVCRRVDGGSIRRDVEPRFHVKQECFRRLGIATENVEQVFDVGEGIDQLVYDSGKRVLQRVVVNRGEKKLTGM